MVTAEFRVCGFLNSDIGREAAAPVNMAARPPFRRLRADLYRSSRLLILENDRRRDIRDIRHEGDLVPSGIETRHGFCRNLDHQIQISTDGKASADGWKSRDAGNDFARRRSSKPDHQKGSDSLSSLMILPHIRSVAENDALRLHSGDPLANGAARQPDLASQCFKRKPGILLKKTQYLVVLFVHAVTGSERLQAKNVGQPYS